EVRHREPQVAVMVSGNAMAHLYVGLEHRERRGWASLASEWSGLLDALLERPSVDVALLPTGDGSCLVTSRRGSATVRTDGARWWYTPVRGDPLGLGRLDALDASAACAATAASDYPDALVQITSIAACARSGDIIVS